MLSKNNQVCYDRAMQKRFTTIYVILGILLFLSIVGGLYYVLATKQNKAMVNRNIPYFFRRKKITSTTINTLFPTIISPTSSFHIFPPLYSALKWKIIDEKVNTWYMGSNKELVEKDSYRSESILLSNLPSGFTEYYMQALSTRGWNQTMMSSGDNNFLIFYTYENKGNYISFGVKTMRNQGMVEYYAFVMHN